DRVRRDARLRQLRVRRARARAPLRALRVRGDRARHRGERPHLLLRALRAGDGGQGGARPTRPGDGLTAAPGARLASPPARYGAPVPSPFVELEVGGRVVRVTNPDKVYFPARGETKLDLVRYYLSVADGIVRALYERPTQLRRFPDGVEGEAIYQKRVPEKRPDWIETARVRFPSGRHADELCVTEVAQVAWAANLGTVDFHPCPSRRRDTEHPDELRIDVDPQPGTTFA